MAVKIQLRRDLAANWGSSTVLASGEVGYETDTGNIKIGDGTTQWGSLAYYQLPNVSVNPAISGNTDLNDADYRVMGRYRLNSVTGGSTFTNVPSDFAATVDADSVSTLIVTWHAYPSDTPTMFQQTLTQFSASGTDLKQWVRLYNGTDYTAWTSTAHLSVGEVTTETLASSAVTYAKLASDILQVLVPIGSIIPFAGSSAPSSQWLLCNGSAVSQATYPALYVVLGSIYGSNAGGNFTLPDLRGQTAVGVNGAGTYAATLGTTGGSANAIVVAHSHTATSTSSVSDPGHRHTYNAQDTVGGGGGGYSMSRINANAGNNLTGFGSGSINTSTTGISVSTSTSVASTGSAATNANLQPFIALNFIIRAL